MRYIIYIIVIGAIVALTFGLFNQWGWHGFVPNLLLLTILSVTLAFNNFDYLVVGVIGGIWFDTLYGLPIGSFSIPFIVCGLLCSLAFQRWLFTEVKIKHFIFAAILATVMLNFWIWLYTNGLYIVKWSPLAVDGWQLLRNTPLAVIANVLLAYPVYVIVELIAQSSLKLKRHKIKL